MADWKSFTIQVPGKDLLEPVRNVLETLLIFLEIAKVLLETIKAFLVDFGNPIKALVEALIKLIEELFLALKASGFFMYLDVPNPTIDPNFNLVYGGFQAFTDRFKGSLFDTRDFNRPQPRSGSTTGGFVLMLVEATDPFRLIRLIKQLLRFFGQEFLAPRFEAPRNFQVIPVGAEGDPLLRLADVFTSIDSDFGSASLGPFKKVQLSWTLPTSSQAPDAGFSDVVNKVASEFIPPSWVIEKSVEVNPAARKITIEDLSNDDSTGLVEFDRETSFTVGLGGRFVGDQSVVRRTVLQDEQNEPFIKFQKYIVVGAATNVVGQLGRFRYIDSDVEFDKTYYYRVRAFSGDILEANGGLNVSDDRLQNLPTNTKDLKKAFGSNSQIQKLKWPGVNDTDIVMGKPSPLVQVKIPTDYGDFNVVEVLKALFKTAFGLDFHQELARDPVTGEVSSKFTDDSLPIPPTPVTEIGRGSLTNVAGALVGVSAIPVLGSLSDLEGLSDDEFSPGKQILADNQLFLPHAQFNVRRQAARAANIVTSAMLQAGQDIVIAFRGLMRGSLPRGPINDAVVNLQGANSLEKVVFAWTKLPNAPDATDPDPTAPSLQSAGLTFVNGYQDANLRLNILEAINFIKSFTLGGVPPDWFSIVPLRDIIPWSGQFLYDLLDKIQALIDAFNGFLDEIRAFIDLLIRKIDALERFIQFLIEILNFIESLELSVRLLSATGLSSLADWISAVDNAGGDKPSPNPGGYSAGLALAYVAPDVAAFETAFGLIFGS